MKLRRSKPGRRELAGSNSMCHEEAITGEVARRQQTGTARWSPQQQFTEAENAIERWLDPEPVDRSLITEALWEMERHYWWPPKVTTGPTTCVCGAGLEDMPAHEAMRRHKEDILAGMLGLSVRPDPEGE